MSKAATRLMQTIQEFTSGFVLLFAKKAHTLFIEPRSTLEEDRRKESILNILLVGTITLLFILLIYVIIRGDEHSSGMKTLEFLPIPIAFCAFLFISRKGYVRLASTLFVTSLYGGATYGIILWGFGMHMSLLTYVLIIAISSILLGTAAGFIMTSVIGITLISTSILQTNDIIVPDWYWFHEPDRYKAEQFFFMLLLITVVSWLSNREIHRSLKRAQESEAALKIERDQLEIKIAERTNELKKSQLEKVADMYKLVEFGRLSSGIFHDLMSPLNAVAICVEQLSKGDIKKSDIQKYVSLAVNASRRMQNFLHKAGKQIKDHSLMEEFCARTVFAEASELLNYKSRLQGVKIHIEQASPIVWGNPLRLHQVATNLLSNAIDSFEHHIRDEEKSVSVRFGSTKAQTTITVTDNGSGIPAGNINRIFEPFFTTKSVHNGTGIGLAITKNIIEKEFAGTLSVSSTVEKGTVFTIFIPNDHFTPTK